MIPTRLLVVQRLCTLLEEIQFDGTTLDLTGKVTRGRNIIGDEVKPTVLNPVVLNVLEAPRPDFATYSGEDAFMRKDSMILMIQGRAMDDKLLPGDSAYYLAAAVEQRLSRVMAVNQRSGMPKYPEHHLLGNLITGMEVAPPVVRPPEDKVSAWAFFFLVLRVGIAVDISEPYTAAP